MPEHTSSAPRWQHQVHWPTTAHTTAFGRHLAAFLRAGDLIVLTGDLGAGKTTLTQGIGAGLGVRGRISSPTFIIARTHRSTGQGPHLVHVDAYRLHTLAEIDDLDLDTALEESVLVVEWGAGLVEGLAEDRLEITIHRQRGAGGDVGEQPRTATLSGYGIRWAGVEPRELTALARDTQAPAPPGQDAPPSGSNSREPGDQAARAGERPERAR